MFFTLAYKNAPIKSNWWTIALCLDASVRKYFNVLMEAVGDQVSPTNSLFCRSPLTTILIFNLSRLPSDWIFTLYTSMHGVTGSPSFWSSIRKVWLLIRFFIYLRFAFSQGFLMFSDDFVTSAKFLGSGLKWETSEPDSPEAVNYCKISFTIILNTLCKPFPMLHVAFNAPFHSDCLCLILSRILRRASLLLTFGWVWFLSRMPCNVSVLIRLSSNSSFSWRFFRNWQLWENLVSFQNLETLLKWQNCQKILENLGWNLLLRR